jgi:hypothetical protein
VSTDSPDPASAGVRNATLGDQAAMLRDQQARGLDIVAPAWAIRAENGQLPVTGAEPVLGPDGVTLSTGTYTPTEVCDHGLADKLAGIMRFTERCRRHPERGASVALTVPDADAAHEMEAVGLRALEIAAAL